ncbi:MAG: tetratricopeptide repeat protein [Deltaproteobacteria bacterium]|nr:MAG: tetratricopeptide repeat protein [Deltaproteobacteria bacterium]
MIESRFLVFWQSTSLMSILTAASSLRSRWVLVAIVIVFSGCGLRTLIEGEYYLNQEKYSEGAKHFHEVLQRNPSDPDTNYYMGRCLLSLSRPHEARPYLERATSLSPNRAQYHFWLGVCYHELKKPKMERASYLRAVELDRHHIQSHLFLGHNYLEDGRWKEALGAYGRVLTLQPDHPQALYNRGLALNRLRRYPEEIAAWKEYLRSYPEGKWAIQAVDHLNARGNFEYRNFTIGYRRVPLEQIRFKPSTNTLQQGTKPSLEVIGSILRTNKKIYLAIIGYKKGDEKLAKSRAKSIQSYLTSNFPTIAGGRLTSRGAGGPERISIGSRIFMLDESINFVTIKR